MSNLWNDILCWLEDFVCEIFTFINDVFGKTFGFELECPDFGCEE
jgi:hypothetical protein